MKIIHTIVLIFLIPFTTSAQTFLTIGEVFNFEIGDEFHTTGNADSQPPNADRIKIIDKYYSSDSNTVFYVRYHDSYESSVGNNNQLVYNFWTKTDTVNYSNLDSAITSSQYWAPYDTAMNYYDTIIEYSDNYCDSLINGYEFSGNPFEPFNRIILYGKGIGQVKDFYNDPAEFSMFDNILLYYKKNGIDCGIPDTTAVSVPEINMKSTFSVYPNPASDQLIVDNKDNTKIESIILTRINGQIIKQFNPGETHLNISDLSSGIYILRIKSKKGDLVKKIIIEK